MLFSLAWLRELCPVPNDPGQVASALTARGLTVDSVTALGEDHALDIDIPANRSDCLGHLGVARELAAAFGRPLAQAAGLDQELGGALARLLRVEIEDPALCPRYTARLVRSVRVGPSPDWVVRRLECCGLRSINNVVDASNLVLLELGHPIHFFDFERVARAPGEELARILVRRARPAERLLTLDGIERQLSPAMLLIADGSGPLAIAGVMGGASSEIRQSTREVLIEAACFQAQSVRATSRQLGLTTDASYRFERGVDAAGAVRAQALAVNLLERLAGAKAIEGLLDAYPSPAQARRLTLRASLLRRLLGLQLEEQRILDALTALQFQPATIHGDFQVSVPSWRHDIEREADLVEEVARHIGYDVIPAATAVEAVVAGASDRERACEERCRDLLAHQGFQEAISFSMIGAGEDDRFVPPDSPPALVLGNPIAEPLARLRRSILPGLLRAVDFNLRRAGRDVRLFETGRVFLARGQAGYPLELQRAGLVWTGSARPPHWSEVARPVDLYDLMGLVEHLLQSLAPGTVLQREPCALPLLHPGLCVGWKAAPSGRVLAWGGRLHPELEHDLEQALFLAEVDLEALVSLPVQAPRQLPLPRVPAVSRDLSIVMTGDVPYSRVLRALERVQAPAPAEFTAIDRYTGPPLESGQASLTVRVSLQPLERTLTEAEIEAYRRELIAALARDLAVGIRTDARGPEREV